MKAKFLLWLVFFGCVIKLDAQRRCGSAEYMKQALINNPSLKISNQHIERFIQTHNSHSTSAAINARPAAPVIIKIPVVIHVIYHLPVENISLEAIHNQMEALNRDYRRTNADSINTPVYFKELAADSKIEFELAKVDPEGKATSGIERVYSPVAKWFSDDKMKYTSGFGANGWDAESYLNIWVCNMYDLLGYSSIMGDAKEKDGVVINYFVFNNLDDGGDYNSGRSAVHEIGHWLSLKHLWGDADCGDDGVDDTPQQSTYTAGCPGGIRTSCGNSPNGDMYMNFMDYTNDPCMNLFTNGQKDRMRALFNEGGFRNSILSSRALGEPWIQSIPLPDGQTVPASVNLFPDPAGNELTLDTRTDSWIGKEIFIVNITGQVIMHHTIGSKKDKLNVSSLVPGIYFIRGSGNNEKMILKFVKL
jgi:hypothetical protein